MLRTVGVLCAVFVSLSAAYTNDYDGSETGYEASKATERMYREMLVDIVGDQTLEQLKADHERVEKGKNCIPPANVEQYDTHPLLKIDREKLPEAKAILTSKIKEDLHLTTMPNKLSKKIDEMLTWSKIVNEYTNDFFQIDISGEVGGTSIIRVAMLGMKKVKDDEIVLGISMYHEEWTEQANVRILTDHPVWQREVVTNWVKLELYNKVQAKLIAHQRKAEL
mmetsp:Transcript_49574/g.79126  ORF Transcript_49574/g.79126 Transcript_49574/m.79126 type:complete len:223 (+) Transcript_49574:108-776(+)|eukprot:CAMPEP_0197049620 /NCGR_PEP_ID=MMETSP1384-20130603/24729_1 /TAXON_ID=29189 /ORGANISM="Ammonia sp." /LENGTH=222 /DNA_ID=CAMNT_0042481923 /DNA_START=394 /DNA_END=1062 /DNA_ORIENTATION=+